MCGSRRSGSPGWAPALGLRGEPARRPPAPRPSGPATRRPGPRARCGSGWRRRRRRCETVLEAWLPPARSAGSRQGWAVLDPVGGRAASPAATPADAAAALAGAAAAPGRALVALGGSLTLGGARRPRSGAGFDPWGAPPAAIDRHAPRSRTGSIPRGGSPPGASWGASDVRPAATSTTASTAASACRSARPGSAGARRWTRRAAASTSLRGVRDGKLRAWTEMVALHLDSLPGLHGLPDRLPVGRPLRPGHRGGPRPSGSAQVPRGLLDRLHRAAASSPSSPTRARLRVAAALLFLYSRSGLQLAAAGHRAPAPGLGPPRHARRAGAADLGPPAGLAPARPLARRRGAPGPGRRWSPAACSGSSSPA